MENNKHFLEWITVEEFKCFSNFHAEGFKRVNLIGGKNNVGKTALMEAIYINTSSINVATITTAIHGTKFMRENLNLLFNQSNKDIILLDKVKIYKTTSSKKMTSFYIKEENGVKTYEIKLNEDIFDINANLFNFSHRYINNVKYIDSFGFTNDEVVYVFNSVQKLDEEQSLNKNINEFDSSIQNFKVIDGKPQCKSNGVYREITEFGDGLRSYISIICSLYACQNGYLFIDEIDNGIYYEHFDRLWEIILTLSTEMNCQVFATTHSKEMLESFARVAKKLEEQDVSYTTLVRNKSNELKAITRDYEMLMDSMEDGREVR